MDRQHALELIVHDEGRDHLRAHAAVVGEHLVEQWIGGGDAAILLDHLLSLGQKLDDDRLAGLHDREVPEQAAHALGAGFECDGKRIGLLDRLAERAALHVERDPNTIENGLGGGRTEVPPRSRIQGVSVDQNGENFRLRIAHRVLVACAPRGVRQHDAARSRRRAGPRATSGASIRAVMPNSACTLMPGGVA